MRRPRNGSRQSNASPKPSSSSSGTATAAKPNVRPIAHRKRSSPSAPMKLSSPVNGAFHHAPRVIRHDRKERETSSKAFGSSSRAKSPWTGTNGSHLKTRSRSSRAKSAFIEERSGFPGARRAPRGYGGRSESPIQSIRDVFRRERGLERLPALDLL